MMTGRDLILYILENHLEDEEIFKDGKFIGFMTVAEAAIKFEVGFETVIAWYKLGMLPGIPIGSEFYIPANIDDPRNKK